MSQRKLSRYPDIVKWKPPNQWTIDFEINHVASPEGGYVELLSGIGQNQTVRFDGTPRYPFNPQTMILSSEDLAGSPTGTIIEFQWNTAEEKLEVARTVSGEPKIRFDKTKPNRIEIAKDVWEDIHLPTDEATMRGSRFSLVFRYHNRVKWDLFSYIAKGLPRIDGINIKSRTLLSIGSGKGGDANKWESSGFTHVICVEPNEENRLELQRRLASTNLQYQIIPTTGQDVDEIVRQVREFAPSQKVETVSYMLSLSFFFDSKIGRAHV